MSSYPGKYIAVKSFSRSYGYCIQDVTGETRYFTGPNCTAMWYKYKRDAQAQADKLNAAVTCEREKISRQLGEQQKRALRLAQTVKGWTTYDPGNNIERVMCSLEKRRLIVVSRYHNGASPQFRASIAGLEIPLEKDWQEYGRKSPDFVL